MEESGLKNAKFQTSLPLIFCALDCCRARPRRLRSLPSLSAHEARLGRAYWPAGKSSRSSRGVWLSPPAGYNYLTLQDCSSNEWQTCLKFCVFQARFSHFFFTREIKIQHNFKHLLRTVLYFGVEIVMVSGANFIHQWG